MEFVTRKEGIAVSKPNGTDVVYYLFSEFEVHYNEFMPGTVQEWHHHNKIEEVLYLVEGRLEAQWIQDEEIYSRPLSSGDLVRVKNYVHTFLNPFPEKAVGLVFRFVPDGTDKRDLIKNDKVLDPHPILLDAKR